MIKSLFHFQKGDNPEKIITNDPNVFNFLYLLIIADCIYIGLHFISPYFSILDDRRLYLFISTDGGYAEVFQYIKFCWCIGLTLLLFARFRNKVYVVWSFIMLCLLLDDALKIHETMGEALVDRLGIGGALRLRGQDYGELMVSAAFGLIFLMLIGYIFIRGSDVVRRVNLDLLLLLGLLAFFGVFVDMAHQFFSEVPQLYSVVTFVEDGGEMIAVSLMCWYILTLYNRRYLQFISSLNLLYFLLGRKKRGHLVKKPFNFQ